MMSKSLSSRSSRSRVAWWGGWVLGGLLGLAMLAGGVVDVLRLPFAREGIEQAGYSPGVMVPLGVVVIASALLYLIPRTAGVGAILLTAYMGGAVATHAIKGDGPEVWVVPVVVAVLLWVALLLRDRKMRVLLPWG